MSTPQQNVQNARLEQIKRSWQQKRQIGERLDKIKTKIGVYSGKGGVGKTTVAVNLAVTLAKEGARVGILDVDIDCPNVTKVLAANARPGYIDGRIIPAEEWGVKVVSMAFFQENQEEAIIWRGPMIHNAINQFLQNTDWDELDYLVVDLPPGTSDSPLTMMQSLPMDGFVVVSTPQDLAVLDAKRCINMIRKLNLNVVGVVECRRRGGKLYRRHLRAGWGRRSGHGGRRSLPGQHGSALLLPQQHHAHGTGGRGCSGGVFGHCGGVCGSSGGRRRSLRTTKSEGRKFIV